MGIKNKVLILLIFSSVMTFGILGLIFYSSLISMQNRIVQVSEKEIAGYKKEKLKKTVENQVSLLQAMYKKYTPTAEKDAVYDLIKDILRNSKNSDGAYYFAYKYDGTKVVWAQNPIEEETTNMMNWKDLDGTFVIKEFNNAAKKGGGYVSYSVPGKDSGDKETMVAYVKGMPEEDIYIGAEILESVINKEVSTTKIFMKGEQSNLIFNVIYGIMAVLLVITIVFSLIFRRFKINITSIKEFLGRIKVGDMSYRVDIKSKDELEDIGNLLNEVGTMLEKVSSEMKREVNLFDDSIQEVKKGNEAILKQGVLQSGELNEALKAVQNAEVIVESSVTKSNEAKETSLEAKNRFEAILKASQALIQAVYIIIESYKKIESVSSVVEEMAFHSNILSLNAAVEAAKAGESGKGFAVVAVEMKHLAFQSKKSSNEVKRMLNDTFSKIDEGKKMAELTVDNIRNILSNTSDIYEKMVNVNSLGAEEKKMLENINSRLITLNDSLFKGMEMTEVVVSNAQVLSERGAEVVKHISFFRSETEDDILFGNIEKLMGNEAEKTKTE